MPPSSDSLPSLASPAPPASDALRSRLERITRMACAMTRCTCAVVVLPDASDAWVSPDVVRHDPEGVLPDVVPWSALAESALASLLPVEAASPLPTVAASEPTSPDDAFAPPSPFASALACPLIATPADDASSVWGLLWLLDVSDPVDASVQVLDDLAELAADARRHAVNASPSPRILRSALDSYPFALAIFDPDLHYVYHNHRSAVLAERPGEDVAGLHPEDVFPPEICDPLLPLLHRCREQGRQIQEKTQVPIDGSLREVIITYTPVFRDDGSLDVIIGTARDVTPEQEARRTIRRERDLLRGIADTSAAAILVIDREGDVDFANERAEALLGVSRERLLQDPPEAEWWAFYDRNGDRIATEDLPFFRVLRTGEPVFDVEGAMYRDDGSRIVLSTNAAPILDADGRVDRVVMLVEDVTERVQREERIREHNEALTTLAKLRTERGDDFVDFLDRVVHTATSTLDVDRVNAWLLDEDDAVLRCVAAATSAPPDDAPPDASNDTDAASNALVGQELTVDDVPDYVDALRQSRALLVCDVSEDERVRELHDYFQTHGIVSMLDAPVRVDGELVGVVCHERIAPPAHDGDAPSPEWTHEDQTFASSLADFVAQAVISAEQKRAQAALRRSEQRWKSLVDYHPGGVVISVDGHFVYANPAAANLVGAPNPESLIGKDIQASVSEDERETLLRRKARIERGEPTKPWEHRITGYDGKERIVVSHSVPIIYDGQMAAQTVIRDVTERREREEELREAKEQALEMNRLKTAFLANMSHEIRTPLTSIIGFAELLSEQDLGDASDIATLIRRSSQRLLQTLNSVLDLSRLEAGSMRLYPEAVDVNVLVRETVELFSQQAADAGIDVTLDVPDTPTRALLDPSAVDRIVSNLLGNALKFTEAGGRVDVGVSVVDNGIAVSVDDTGIGIDPAFLPHVFDAFQQESSGPARSHEGTGLGLAISHRLTELMGGTIDVDSEKYQGACFTVTLPRMLPPSARGL